MDRILNYVGSYYLKLDGKVDALVFAGMIGEKSVELRAAVGKKVACLGFGLDESKNTTVDEAEGVVVDIGVLEAGDKKRLLVCRTDEQVRMLRERSASVLMSFCSLRWRGHVQWMCFRMTK